MNCQETSTSKTKYEHEIARIKAVLGQLQSENRELKFSQANSSSLDNGGAGGGGAVGDKDAFNAFSDATKSLSRKMKTNFTSAVTNLVPIKSPTSEDLHALAASEAAVGLANNIFFPCCFLLRICNFVSINCFEIGNPLDLGS